MQFLDGALSKNEPLSLFADEVLACVCFGFRASGLQRTCLFVRRFRA